MDVGNKNRHQQKPNGTMDKSLSQETLKSVQGGIWLQTPSLSVSKTKLRQKLNQSLKHIGVDTARDELMNKVQTSLNHIGADTWRPTK
jgi:hypothetical protein